MIYWVAVPFFAFVVALVVWSIILKLLEWTRKPEAPAPNNLITTSQPCTDGHTWRAITPFVRQCRVRECAAVEFTGDVPDGMIDYVNLMTSRQARADPKGEASHYKELDSRAWGLKCPSCDRVIPGPEDLPVSPFTRVMGTLVKERHCPFCNIALVAIVGRDGLRYEKKS